MGELARESTPAPNHAAGYDHLGAWRVTCGGCGWPLLWAWALGPGGQACRNCTPQLERGRG